jgi:hypothetical protein
MLSRKEVTAGSGLGDGVNREIVLGRAEGL